MALCDQLWKRVLFLPGAQPRPLDHRYLEVLAWVAGLIYRELAALVALDN